MPMMHSKRQQLPSRGWPGQRVQTLSARQPPASAHAVSTVEHELAVFDAAAPRILPKPPSNPPRAASDDRRRVRAGRHVSARAENSRALDHLASASARASVRAVAAPLASRRTASGQAKRTWAAATARLEAAEAVAAAAAQKAEDDAAAAAALAATAAAEAGAEESAGSSVALRGAAANAGPILPVACAHLLEPSHLLKPANLEHVSRAQRFAIRRQAAAEKAAEKSTTARREANASARETLSARGKLATAMADLGDIGPARVMLQQVLEQQLAALAMVAEGGPEHRCQQREVLRTQKHLSELLKDGLGDHAGAEQLEKALIQGCLRLYGASDERTIEARCRRISSLRMLGETEAARVELHAVVTANTERVGAAHPATLRAQYQLAQLCFHEQEGEEEEDGTRLLSTVVEAASKSLLGKEHPDTRTYAAVLARWRRQKRVPGGVSPSCVLSGSEKRKRLLGGTNAVSREALEVTGCS
jgi:hypothetical protein